MDSQEFVEIINKVVLEPTVNGAIKRLDQPSGRSPAKDILEMSSWYNSLQDPDKQVVVNIVKKSVRDAIFGFLCVLDGAIAIEDEDKGILKLYYKRRDQEVLLNDQNKVNLHELL